MTKHLLLLGRQPALGLAELESLYGSANVQAFGTGAALVDVVVDFGRLGGSIKLAELVDELDFADWKRLEAHLLNHAAELPPTGGDGKLQVGISAYGFRETAARVNATGLSLKKQLRKATDRSVRLVPNQEPALNSAQVFHNKLYGDKGLEIIAVSDSHKTVIARTLAVQDIDSYTIRDRSRPKRDSRVGMLPPKLAQIIINLAVAPVDAEHVILDPFCGTGVLLQEAILMGYEVEGTDIDSRMIDYSRQNLQWLLKRDDIAPNTLAIGDATSHTWHGPNSLDTVAGETYLGRPFTTAPNPEILAKTVSECDLIIKKFLKNVHSQLPADARLCVAVPAWQTRPGQFRHLPLIDQIRDFGYNRVKFEQVRDDQLLYYREDQVVARQLLVLTKR